tara:strand:- start:101 stop:1027 length:927 start_codon:yes stop_codon:yes gene_type:complete
MNYYDILGVNKNSTQDEIKKAWRKKQFITHPDQNKGDNSKNIEYSKVNEAYETLSNKNKKHMYDLGSQFNFNEIHQNKTNNELSDVINEMFYSSMKPSKKNNKQMNDFFNGLMDDPIIETMFTSSPINMMSVSYPEDIVIEHTVQFLDSYKGVSIPINISRQIVKNNNIKNEKETIYVDIPKGCDNNEIITINGKGNIINDVQSDIKLKILLDQHDKFKRSGLDLILTKEINFKESLCGFEFVIEHLAGQSFKFKNSSGKIIQNMDEKIIPNLGFTRKEKTGNLIIKFKVIIKKSLTETQINKISEIL